VKSPAVVGARVVHSSRGLHVRLTRVVGAIFLGTALAVTAIPAAAAPPAGASSALVNRSTHLPAGMTPVLRHQPPSVTGRTALRARPAPNTGPTPELSYYGGRVVSSVSVIQVLYGSGAYEPEVSSRSTPSIYSFYLTATRGFYFDWLSEYNTAGQAIGRGSVNEQQIVITPASANNGSTIDDTNIQAELTAQVAAHILPSPDANTLFAVYFPAGKTITRAGKTSGVDFCGYHSTTSTPEMYYSVLPDFSTGGMATGCGNGTEYQNMTAVSSHELVEATTDPEVGLASTLGAPLAWYDVNYGEIADICLGLDADVVLGDGNQYRIQGEWSNRQNACVISGGQGVVAVNAASSWVMESTGVSRSFVGPTPWSSSSFYGSAATLSGDITASGHDSLVAVNNGSIWVMTSDGSRYSAPILWSNISIVGTRATLLADVNGDGMADLVAVGSNSGNFTTVKQSTGSSFGSQLAWSTSAFYGTRATLAVDVNGDGRADLVAVNDSSIWVMRSVPKVGFPGLYEFSPPELWSTTPFYGSLVTLGGDVNGDGIGDLVAVNNGSTWVIKSTGTGFSAPTRWLSVPFYGSRATMLADVSGNGGNDLVAVNDASTYVAETTGSAFSAPSAWSRTLFYGRRATLVGS
jgi:hypothetical protein